MKPTLDYTPHLRARMQEVGLTQFKQLSEITGVSERQILRLRRGEIAQMRLEVLSALAQGLKLSLSELVQTFSPDMMGVDEVAFPNTLPKEYQRLQNQLHQQEATLRQKFQAESLATLESWLIYWSAAAAAAKRNPNLPAIRLLPLVKPIEQLLANWGVEGIGVVGEEVEYNPQWHQLIEGMAHPGDWVTVRNTGYRQGEKLLHRAKVSPKP